jgi:hypothetical protein
MPTPRKPVLAALDLPIRKEPNMVRKTIVTLAAVLLATAFIAVDASARGGGGGGGGHGGGFGGGGFGGGFGGSSGSSSTFEKASKACASLRPSGGGFGGGGGGGFSGFSSALASFRSCMKSHGEPIPTARPTSPPTGGSSGADRFLNGLNPSNSKVAAALKACESKLPSFAGGSG